MNTRILHIPLFNMEAYISMGRVHTEYSITILQIALSMCQ